MNRPHQDNARFVHTFIRTVTTTNFHCAFFENSKWHGFDPILAGCTRNAPS